MLETLEKAYKNKEELILDAKEELTKELQLITYKLDAYRNLYSILNSNNVNDTEEFKRVSTLYLDAFVKQQNLMQEILKDTLGEDAYLELQSFLDYEWSINYNVSKIFFKPSKVCKCKH